MSTPRLRPLVGPAQIAAGSALLMSVLLTGCGVAGTNFHPGVAADVGDISITTDHVDAVATVYCQAIEDQLAADNQILPQSYLRGGIVGVLALKAVAEQLADLYDVSTGQQYIQKISGLEQAVSALSEDEQDAVIEVEASPTYVSDIQLAIGTKLLMEQGAAEPTSEQAAAKAQQVFTEWIDDNDVEIDPEYGVGFVDGVPVPTDTDVSFAAGDTAKLGGADNPDPDYAAGLPAAHRCG